MFVLSDTAIASLEGAPSLQEMGVVRIFGGEMLTDVSPLLAVPTWERFDLFALPNLTTIEIVHDGANSEIDVVACPALATVRSRPGVIEFGRLFLAEAHALTELQLPSLQRLTEGVKIVDAPALQSLDGLSSLEFLDAWLQIEFNPQLCQSSVEGLSTSTSRFGFTTAFASSCARCRSPHTTLTSQPPPRRPHAAQTLVLPLAITAS